MAAITTTVTAITEMVRGRTESILLNTTVGQPTLNSVQHLVEQLANFASHFATTKYCGKHGFLLLVLSEAKMQLATGDNNLDCERLNKTELLKPRIADSNKGRQLLQLQEDQKVDWK